MKAASRETLAAALLVGAAVFAWPVQALQCPMPPYWRDVVPIKQVPKAAWDYARSRIAEAQSIFIGRIVSVEYAPFPDRGGVYVITYEVSEWLKGRGQPYAKIAWYPGIPCADKCPAEETKHALRADKTNGLVFADKLSESVQFATLKRDDLDGVDLPCAEPHSIPIAAESLPSPSDREYDEVTFRNALRTQLQALRRNSPFRRSSKQQ